MREEEIDSLEEDISTLEEELYALQAEVSGLEDLRTTVESSLEVLHYRDGQNGRSAISATEDLRGVFFYLGNESPPEP